MQWWAENDPDTGKPRLSSMPLDLATHLDGRNAATKFLQWVSDGCKGYPALKVAATVCTSA
jgi:hypothetical protein